MKGVVATMLILAVIHLLLAANSDARLWPFAGSKSEAVVGSGVQLYVDSAKGQVVLNNGIIEVTFSNPEGSIVGIQYQGLDNVLEFRNKENDRGYWDLNVMTSPLAMSLLGTEFKIISQTPDKVEISFVMHPTQSFPVQVDKRFIMLRDNHGIYPYMVIKREQGSPSMGITQIRTAYKLRTDKFDYMAVSEKIQRIMPTAEDRLSSEPLTYKEAVLLTNPSNPELKGEVDDKYQYSLEDKDTKVIGWISSDPSIGVWVLTPSHESRSAGPVKQDLTAHVGPTLLAAFFSSHYVGEDIIMKFGDGEAWTKVLGPYMLYLNSGDRSTLWQNANQQLAEEVKKWPYDFVSSQDFPKANERCSISGTFLVNDGFKAPKSVGSAWIGLAAPGDAGSWQTETKGYQFWNQSEADGRFLIKNIHAGNYSLYAWVPGYIGDFKYATQVIIKPGDEINLGNVVYEPPRVGPTIWEIGVPDRSAAEFYVPDPNPKLANGLLVHDEENKYRQYGLWDRYSDIYPKQDLIYTVGVSDFHRDWFYAHVLRKTNGTYQPTTWQIVFPVEAVTPNAYYTLRIALASATFADLQVQVNLQARPLVTIRTIGRDNAIARHGIHGLYSQFSVDIPSSLLKNGDNTIFLTQTRNSSTFSGVMYDYIRLEAPSSSS